MAASETGTPGATLKKTTAAIALVSATDHKLLQDLGTRFKVGFLVPMISPMFGKPGEMPSGCCPRSAAGVPGGPGPAKAAGRHCGCIEPGGPTTSFPQPVLRKVPNGGLLGFLLGSLLGARHSCVSPNGPSCSQRLPIPLRGDHFEGNRGTGQCTTPLACLAPSSVL